ncbi:Uncharacterised protein [Segatella copri]|nr:Uncharacterised protein [Segatella copri]
MIMSVRMIGVDGLLYIFNNLIAVEASHIVAFKERRRYVPVCITMFNLVAVPMIIVRHVVKIDMDRFSVQ